MQVARTRPEVRMVRISWRMLASLRPTTLGGSCSCHDVGSCSTFGANAKPACQHPSHPFLACCESSGRSRAAPESLSDSGPILGPAPCMDAGRNSPHDGASALDLEPPGTIFVQPQLSARAARPIYARLCRD